MKIDLSPEIEAELNRAAAGAGTSPAEYVRQLVEQHLDHDAWFRGKVNRSLQSLDQGEFITHEDMRIRIEKMFGS